MKAKVGNVSAKLNMNGMVWVVVVVVVCLFADYIVLLLESEGKFQRVVDGFYSVLKKRKLKMNAGKK